MKTIWLCRTIVCGVVAVVLFVVGATAETAARVYMATMEQVLAENNQRLKQYEWTETMVVHSNGDKSTSQYICRYRPDGAIQRTPKDVSNMNDKETVDDAQRVLDLARRYLAISPEGFQTNTSDKSPVALIDAGRWVRLMLYNYQLDGDLLMVDLDPNSRRLLGASASMYFDDVKDTMKLVLHFSALPDGTTYTSNVVLKEKFRHIGIKITNSNYRLLGVSASAEQ